MGSVALKGALDVEVNVRRKGPNVTVSASKMKDSEPFDDKHYKITDVQLDWLANPEAGPGDVPEWQRGAVLTPIADPVATGDPNVPGKVGRPNKTADKIRDVLKGGKLTMDDARDRFCSGEDTPRATSAKAFNRTVKTMREAGALIWIEEDDTIALPLSGHN